MNLDLGFPGSPGPSGRFPWIRACSEVWGSSTGLGPAAAAPAPQAPGTHRHLPSEPQSPPPETGRHTRLRDGGQKVSCPSAGRRSGVGAGSVPPVPEGRGCAAGRPATLPLPHWLHGSQGPPGTGTANMAAAATRPRRVPGRPGRGSAPRPGHGHSSQPAGVQRGPGGAGRRELGWVGGPGRARARGRERNKRCFVERGREKSEHITQCPEAMLVTREAFSASLGKQLGAERDRERVNPMGPRPPWEVGSG